MRLNESCVYHCITPVLITCLCSYLYVMLFLRSPAQRKAFGGVILAVLCSVYVSYRNLSPLTYGWPALTSDELAALRWRESWDILLRKRWNVRLVSLRTGASITLLWHELWSQGSMVVLLDFQRTVKLWNTFWCLYSNIKMWKTLQWEFMLLNLKTLNQMDCKALF